LHSELTTQRQVTPNKIQMENKPRHATVPKPLSFFLIGPPFAHRACAHHSLKNLRPYYQNNMTHDEIAAIQALLKSLRETQSVVHNLAAVASSALTKDQSQAEQLRKSLLAGLEVAQQSASAAQQKLVALLAQPSNS